MEATTIDVGGLRTRVRVEGDPADPPVLLLHGIGRFLEDWDPQFERLSDAHRVIALDLPGFGRSQRRPGPATLEELARGAFATLEALGEKRPVSAIGNSLGGAVALQMLALAPERIARLVLVNPAGFGPEVTYLLRMLAVPGLGPAMLRRPTAAGVRHIERALYADRRVATPARVSHALGIARDPEVAAVFGEVGRRLGTVVRGVRPGWRQELLAAVARHPRPTLIVWGDRDRILPPRHFAAARRAFPHARTHMFAGTGHLPQVERADGFAALVRWFLADPA